MNEEEKELLKNLLIEISEIKKELKRIANYLEVIAKKTQVEALLKYGREIEIKEK